VISIGNTVTHGPSPVPETAGRTLRGLSRVREIELRGGGVTVVDGEDYRRVVGMPWKIKRGAKKRPYVAACVRLGPGPYDWGYVLLHRLLCGLQSGDGLCVDHIDGDALNNRRSNLRVCSLAENARNRRPTSGRNQFKGVSAQAGRFVAKYNTDYLGAFDSAVEAALAYNAESFRRCGQFSRPNRIHDEDAARELISEREQLTLRMEQIANELREWPCA